MYENVAEILPRMACYTRTRGTMESNHHQSRFLIKIKHGIVNWNVNFDPPGLRVCFVVQNLRSVLHFLALIRSLSIQTSPLLSIVPQFNRLEKLFTRY